MTKLQAKEIPAPSDLAFEEFRKIFPVSVNCLVDPNGNWMNFRLRSLDSMVRNMKRAKEVIVQQKLPLDVSGLSNYCTHILHVKFINPSI